MTVTDAVRGTAKIGRWVYPARRIDDGRVERNTKRDGTGEWVPADPGKFVADETDAPKIAGFTEDGHSDYDDLRVAYGYIFDDFAVTYDGIAAAVGCDLARAKAIVSMLRSAGLVTTETRHEVQHPTDPKKPYTMVQSLKTYDNHTRDEVMADFAEAFGDDVHIRRSSGHGGKAGAQSRKPGRSTWQVGGKCPQGHKLGEGDIYTMPSGRKQCRKCRAGYSSNA